MRIECPECNGSGEVDYGITLECPVCEGSGEIDKDEFLDESAAYGIDCPGGKCEM